MSSAMNLIIKPIFQKCCMVRLPRASTNLDSARYLNEVNLDNKQLNFKTAEYTNVSESVIREKLKALSIPFTDGYTCFHLNQCTLCNSIKCNNTDTDVYVNKKTGFFLCDQCHISGKWNTFKNLLEKSKLEEKQLIIKEECFNYGKDLSNWKTIVDSSTALKDLKLQEFQDILNDFKLPIVFRKNVSPLQIRISKDKSRLYFPFFFKNKIIGFKTLEKNGSTQIFPMNDCFGILQFKTSKQTESAVLIARIQDFFALISQNIPYDILCLPYGGSHLPQSILPLLENYEKLILWLGELGGLDSTGNFAKKLHDKRCYNVRPIKNQVTAEKAVLENENVEQIIKKAAPTYHEFIITFNSLREDVLAELQNKERVIGVPWKKFPGLNKYLKGHRRGELTVITGPTGSGKTTFMSEYSLDLAAQGVNTLWGSFEIRNCRLARTMLQQYSGIQLENNLTQFDYWADKFEQLPIYFMTFHGQLPLECVMETVKHCYYTYDIAHIIIDNVQFMIEVSCQNGQIDRFWKQDFLIQSFRSFATKNNCHVTLVMHPRKGMDGVDLSVNSIFGGAKAAQEADNIFIIQNESLTGQKKYLQICKNRFCGDLGKIPLVFDKSTLSFARSSQPLYDIDDDDYEDDKEEPNSERIHSILDYEDLPNPYDDLKKDDKLITI